MERKLLTLFAFMAITFTFAQFKHNRVYSTFDNIKLAKTDTFNNGADSSGGFTHYGRFFNNNYNSEWKSWKGWSLSNMKDTITPGFGNQFSSITGSGVSGTSNFMVGNGNGAYIKLDSATNVSGAYFTNNTYTALEMKEGSSFSKKFGGLSGDDPDYFMVKVYSYLGGLVVDSAKLYLADYRDVDNSKDYILKDWMYLDFNGDYSVDIKVDSLAFKFESTDTGQYGINTPLYFCMDDFNAASSSNYDNFGWYDSQYKVVHEMNGDSFYNGSDNAGGIISDFLFFPNTYNSSWGSWNGWSYSNMLDDTTPGSGNQYSAINDQYSEFFVAGGQETEIRAPYLTDSDWGNNPLWKTNNWSIEFWVTNTSYSYLDMLNGSGFSKKFGGEDGNDPDYFRLVVSYLDDKDSLIRLDSFYLADYRFTDNSKDYILKDWIEIKSNQGDQDNSFHKVKFKLESSDVGQYGMNTPAFFCFSYNFFVWGDINEKDGLQTIQLYPNPVLNELTVKSEETIENLSFYGMDGKQIENESFFYGQSAKVNTRDLVSGIYFVRVQTDKGIGTKKFIKQ